MGLDITEPAAISSAWVDVVDEAREH
jgi:hypothetical protein